MRFQAEVVSFEMLGFHSFSIPWSTANVRALNIRPLGAIILKSVEGTFL